MNCLSFFLCTFDHLSDELAIRLSLCWQGYELVSLFVNCGFRVQDFHGSVHRNRLVHKVFMTQRLASSEKVTLEFWSNDASFVRTRRLSRVS